MSAAGSAVTLTLAAAVAVGAAVTVSYTVPDGPGAQPIRDAAGNAAAALSERTVRNHTTAVAITSDAGADKTYVFAGGRGTEDSIAITVTFSERVQVTGVPELTLNVGSARKTAAYHAGSGTTALEFRYPVAKGDEDSDGVSVPAGTRVRTGGAISYLADNAAAPAHPELPAQSGHLVDGVPPALITGGAVVNGVTLTLTFDEPLDEGSAPLADGGILAFVNGTSVTPTEGHGNGARSNADAAVSGHGRSGSHGRLRPVRQRFQPDPGHGREPLGGVPVPFGGCQLRWTADQYAGDRAADDQRHGTGGADVDGLHGPASWTPTA